MGHSTIRPLLPSGNPEGGTQIMTTELDWPAIGRRLATMRQARGLSEAEAAEAAEVSPQSWERWERGGAFYTSSMLKICYAHGFFKFKV
jgi:DNA-binding XRE family transcriptional regulator